MTNTTIQTSFGQIEIVTDTLPKSILMKQEGINGDDIIGLSQENIPHLVDALLSLVTEDQPVHIEVDEHLIPTMYADETGAYIINNQEEQAYQIQSAIW